MAKSHANFNLCFLCGRFWSLDWPEHEAHGTRHTWIFSECKQFNPKLASRMWRHRLPSAAVLSCNYFLDGDEASWQNEIRLKQHNSQSWWIDSLLQPKKRWLWNTNQDGFGKLYLDWNEVYLMIGLHVNRAHTNLLKERIEFSCMLVLFCRFFRRVDVT